MNKPFGAYYYCYLFFLHWFFICHFVAGHLIRYIFTMWPEKSLDQDKGHCGEHNNANVVQLIPPLYCQTFVSTILLSSKYILLFMSSSRGIFQAEILYFILYSVNLVSKKYIFALRSIKGKRLDMPPAR